VSLTVATWNVNGIRARETQVRDWIARERPDVVCLQEIKATPAQIPILLCELEGYWCYWHGERAYSGVGIQVRRDRFPQRPAFHHPSFDYECRIVAVDLPGVTVASVYVPNGGKDYAAKLRFLEAIDAWVGERHAAGASLALCGDVNVAREERDVHPRERKANAIGQLPEERALFRRLIDRGLVDVGRALDPDNEGLFTWWPPWRNMRQRNIGWRIDYVLASAPLASRASSSRVLADYGTSDHAPLHVAFEGVGPAEVAPETPSA
jgi:exodeoxyribonuclease-3